jgi:glycosyltransferase involved in cell wall biosynthesis
VARLLSAVAAGRESDVIVLVSDVNADAWGKLLRGADGVLGSSRHERFGRVGVETMAVGGVACTGTSGEEYARAGENGLVFAGEAPGEFIVQGDAVFARANRVEAMRRFGPRTARRYTWERVREGHLLPRAGAFDGLASDAVRVAYHSYTTGS